MFFIIVIFFSFCLVYDAGNGVLFIDFPPVLQLQLKRFEYNELGINDHYKYPLQLDLDRDKRKYFLPEAEWTVPNLYTLHSVLFRVDNGYSYAFIRPTLSNQWFRFDNERVTKEDMKSALEQQYGGEGKFGLKKSYVYMLVYIRESDKEKIICDVVENDIAERYKIRLKKEHHEKELKKKEKAEAHFSTIIKVVRDKDLMDCIGRHMYFNLLVDSNNGLSFHLQNSIPFVDFKWKFSFVPSRGLVSRQDLRDSDIVSSHFQITDSYGEWKQHLGLEHSEDTLKRAYVANQE